MGFWVKLAQPTHLCCTLGGKDGLRDASLMLCITAKAEGDGTVGVRSKVL